MHEVRFKYITVDCPYFNEEVDILVRYAVIKALGYSGEKPVSCECDYSEECTCIETCPGNKLFKR